MSESGIGDDDDDDKSRCVVDEQVYKASGVWVGN